MITTAVLTGFIFVTVPQIVSAATTSFTFTGQVTKIVTKSTQVNMNVTTVNVASLKTLRGAEVTIQLTGRTRLIDAKGKKMILRNVPVNSLVTVEGSYDGKRFTANKLTVKKVVKILPESERILNRIESAIQNTVKQKGKKPKKATK